MAFAWVPDAITVTALAVLAASLVILAVAHRRSRSTLFTDAAWKAAFLVSATTAIGYVAARAAGWGLDPFAYQLASALTHLLVAAFFLLVAIYLGRYAERGAHLVIVSPAFLVAMRNRLRAMYGPAPARFVSYAVGKEAARDAVRQQVEARLVRPQQVWTRLPHYFRLMGYGRLRYLDASPGEVVHVEVLGSFETARPEGDGSGCDLTRGYLAGLGEALGAGRTCECEEVRCGSREGDGRCEFVLRWFDAREAPEKPAAVAARGAV